MKHLYVLSLFMIMLVSNKSFGGIIKSDLTPIDKKQEKLVDAVKKGDIDKLKSLLKENPEYINKIVKSMIHSLDTTLLIIAIEKRQVEVVRLLISFGADVNFPYNHEFVKKSPLLLAVSIYVENYSKDKAIIDRFIQRYQLNEESHPKDKAIIDIIEMLLSAGAGKKLRGITYSVGSQALQLAKEKGRKDIIKLLKKSRAKRTCKQHFEYLMYN